MRNDGKDLEILERLLWHGVPKILASNFNQKYLQSSLCNIISFGKFSFLPGKSPIALVGGAGSGKTLTVVKLAARLKAGGAQPLVISVERAISIGARVLQAHMTQLNIQYFHAIDVSSLKLILRERKDGQPVLIDTEALDVYGADAHAILVEIRAIARAQLCLTLPAGMDAEESADIAEIFQKARTKMMIATKFDQSRRVGNIVAAAACGLALTEAGVGSNIVEGLRRLTPEYLSSRLLHQGDPAMLGREIY
ncbi:P-loop NTPase family protein [Acetobacter nitrogenifigens]|uniref:hypothetical protein n=1 Tax=Acetobacter nitrogenifigens TaxID=285268 RepID=UPI0022301AE7|nr:hypothetical protein [Acetobacter nitrogenifigens]